MGGGGQCLAGEKDDFCRCFIGVMNAVAAQDVAERGRFATGDLRGAETFPHEFEGGFGKGCERTFGAVEETGEKLFREGVDAVGSGGLLAHEGAAAAGEIAEMTVGRVCIGSITGDSGAAGEQCFGDAQQVEAIGAGKEVFAIFLGFVSVDPDDEIAFQTQSLSEVRHIRGLVLAAQKYLVLGDFSMAGGGLNFLEQMLDASRVVLDGKGGFEDVAVAIAD